jgi:hypothetical protein
VRAWRRKPPGKRLPPAPFINVDDQPTPDERIRESASGVVFVVVVLGLPVAALAVALILQATWLPIAGGAAAVVILLFLALTYLGAWPFGSPWS